MKNKGVLRILSTVLSGILLLESPMSALATESVLNVSQETDEQLVQEDEIVIEDDIEQEQQEILQEDKKEILSEGELEEDKKEILQEEALVEDKKEILEEEGELEEDKKEEILSLEEENLLALELMEQTSEGVLLRFTPQEEFSFYELYRQAQGEEEAVLLTELEEIELEEDGTCLYLDAISEENIYTYWIYGYEEKATQEIEDKEEKVIQQVEDKEGKEEISPLAFGGFVEAKIPFDIELTEEEIFESEEASAVEEVLNSEESSEEFLDVEMLPLGENLENENQEAIAETDRETLQAEETEEKIDIQTSKALLQEKSSFGALNGLDASAIKYNSIKISWDKTEGATGYNIYYTTTPSVLDSYKLLKKQSGTSYTFVKAVCGVEYYFKVVPYQKVGKENIEGTASEIGPKATTLDIPALTISKVSYTKVVLKWGKISGAKKYELEFSDDKEKLISGNGTKKVVSKNSYTYNGLTPGKTYFYRIRAIRDSYGTEYSEPIEVTLKELEVTKEKAELSLVKATAYNKIKITWNKQAKASGYELWYAASTSDLSEPEENEYKLLKKQTARTYTFSKAECGKTYYFKVRSYQKVEGVLDYGMFSDVKSEKTELVTTSLNVSKVDYTQVSLKWKKVTGAKGYQLYAAESENDLKSETGSCYLVGTTKSTSYTHKGLSYGETYYYKLKAIRDDYTGEDSNVVSAELPFMKVENLTAAPSTYNSIKISWKKLKGVKGYKIYYSTDPGARYEDYKLLKTQSATSFNFKGAECGIPYYFCVQPYQVVSKTNVYGEYSLIESEPTELAVPVPSISAVEYNQVKIKWKKITGATSYEVYVSQAEDEIPILLGTVTATSYADKEVEVDRSYYYRVKAVRNDYSTEFSEAVYANVSYKELKNVKASSTDDGKIVISWDEVPGMTTYVVERYTSEADALNSENGISFETKKTSYKDSDLKVNKRYYYKVYGYNDSHQTNIVGPVSAKTKIVDDDGSEYIRYGVDVSSYQGTIDWNKVYDSNVRFAMLRILVKSGNKDVKFEENYTNARKAGVKVGVYKYSYATTAAEATAEAKTVIAALNGRKLDYPVALDLEDTVQEKLTNAQRTEIVLAYKKVVEAAGYKFVVYASKYWFDAKLDMSRLADVELWIARWRNLNSGHGYTGKGKVTMWQYSDTGTVNGISGRVDLDVSYKKY